MRQICDTAVSLGLIRRFKYEFNHLQWNEHQRVPSHTGSERRKLRQLEGQQKHSKGCIARPYASKPTPQIFQPTDVRQPSATPLSTPTEKKK